VGAHRRRFGINIEIRGRLGNPALAPATYLYW